MEAADLKRLKELEDENRTLKKLFADVSMQNMVLKDVIEKKL
jgi:putative transposase